MDMAATNKVGGIASIATLDLVATVLEKLNTRHGDLPGFGVVHAPAGWGKSVCANAVANATRGYFVQMRSAWRGKLKSSSVKLRRG